MFKLKIAARAKLQLKQISKKYYQQAISNAFSEIQDDPTLGKPLTLELTGQFSFKLGVYRIVYKVDHQNQHILILRIGHRSKVYS